jgi:hypothetical protein
MDHPPDSESTPLLSPAAPDSQNTPNGRISGFPKLGSVARSIREHVHKWATIYLCGLFIFVVDVPGFMGEAVRIRMYELSICREYYGRADPSLIQPDGNVPEELCKITPVQSELAKFTGTQNVLNEILGNPYPSLSSGGLSIYLGLL